jgi:hypothetical protein
MSRGRGRYFTPKIRSKIRLHDPAGGRGLQFTTNFHCKLRLPLSEYGLLITIFDAESGGIGERDRFFTTKTWWQKTAYTTYRDRGLVFTSKR